jgi:hypothetical protein
MRILVIVVSLLAGAARASEDGDGVVVRPLLGFGVSASDSGGGLAAQLGIRISPLLLRVTADVGGGTGPRGYFFGTVRADWLHPISENVALLAGVGLGALTYGFVFDDPAANLATLMPEVGLLFGPNRSLGRILVGVTGLVPLGTVSHERDFAGREIAPPHVMATALLSL